MREEQRKQALTAWRRIYAQSGPYLDAEHRYNLLLTGADEMERLQLISADEWRKLVQQAGTAFARTAACMGGEG
jgi:hypothetical protein